jgi:hypothetical protein
MERRNVKLSPCLTNYALRHEDVMGRVDVYIPRFLDLGTSWCVQIHVPAALPSGKESPVPTGQEARWALQPVWMKWRKFVTLPGHKLWHLGSLASNHALCWQAKNLDGRAWSRFESMAGSCETDNETSGSIRCWNILIAEQLRVSQQGLSSTELGNKAHRSVVFLQS